MSTKIHFNKTKYSLNYHAFWFFALYPTRFIFEIVSLIFLHPSAAGAGSAIMNIINDYKDGISWLFAIFGIIVYSGFIIFSTLDIHYFVILLFYAHL